MSLLTVPEDDDRHNRLAAIAQLEQQHKLRWSHVEQQGRADSTASRTEKYFLLLVSKGSGNLQQRADQDRAETMVHSFPHEILDGSNVALDFRRNELFEISNIRGNYPQLFLVDNGVTTFVGDFQAIEFCNDEGTLGTLLESQQMKSPKKKTSIVKNIKKMGKILKKSSSVRKDISAGSVSAEAPPSRSSSMIPSSSKWPFEPEKVTNPSSKRSVEVENATVRSSNRSVNAKDLTVSNPSETAEAENGSPGQKQGAKMRRQFADLASFPSIALPEEDAKVPSNARLLISKSEGAIPLESTGRKEKKSKSKSRIKDLNRTSSKNMSTASPDGELILKDEDDDTHKSSKTGSASSKSRSRSKSASKFTNNEEDFELDLKDVENRKSRSRSHSRGRLRDSIKISKDSEQTRSRSHSRGALKDSTQTLKESGEKRRSTSRSRGETTRSTKDDGEKRRSRSTSVKGGRRSQSTKDDVGTMSLKDHGDEQTSKKKPPHSSSGKRGTRNIDSEGRQVEGGETKDVEGSKHRKSRIKREGDEGDDQVSPRKPRSKTLLREKDGEKHPRRRNGVRSASPHKLRAKVELERIDRSKSPGNRRGDIARKREAMREFRDKLSQRNVGDDAIISGSESILRKPRMAMSSPILDISDAARLLSPRRHKSLMPSSNKEEKASSVPVDESLSDLVKRVKDKDKKGRIDEDVEEDDFSYAVSAVPSVQW